MSAKTVLGAGDSTLLLEIKGQSVRIKRRGSPDLFIPLAQAGDVARFLLAAAQAGAPAAAATGRALVRA